MSFQEPLHVVFVHGLFSSPDTWSTMTTVLEEDAIVAPRVRIYHFGYDSPKINLNPTRRIPDIDDIADSLGVYLDSTFRNDEPIILVAHSQGGLVVQRHIVQRLNQAKGRDLQRIRAIILYATPNSGSEFFLSFRRKISTFFGHPQEKDLQPFVRWLADTQRQFLQSVVYAQGVGPSECHIPVSAYAGAADAIVSPASARASLPTGGTLPGDHFSIIRPDGQNDIRYLVLRNEIANSLATLSATESAPEMQPDNLIAVVPVPSSLPPPIFDKPTNQASLAKIVKLLLQVEEFSDEDRRKAVIRFLPRNIRAEVQSSPPARTAIMSLVTVCDRFGNAGHKALYIALDVACPPEDENVQKALSGLREMWNVPQDED